MLQEAVVVEVKGVHMCAYGLPLGHLLAPALCDVTHVWCGCVLPGAVPCCHQGSWWHLPLLGHRA